MSKKAPSEPTSLELRRLVQRFVRDFGLLDQNHTPCGKPLPASHAHALMILLEREPARGAMTQKELGAVLGIDKSNIARLCQRMEEDGHVEQQRSQADGRVRYLVLTQRGAELAREVDRASRARFGAVLQSVPAAEHHAVLHGLRVLADALAAPGAPPPAPPPPVQSSRRTRT